eukprot:6730703-Prymnesium_polylepis.1
MGITEPRKGAQVVHKRSVLAPILGRTPFTKASKWPRGLRRGRSCDCRVKEIKLVGKAEVFCLGPQLIELVVEHKINLTRRL